MSGARPGIGLHCSRAFPAARRQLLKVYSSEDEGTQISGRREIQNVAPPEGAPSLVRPVLLSRIPK